MKVPAVQVIKWTMCALGGLTGLAFAVWLVASGEPADQYFGRTFDEFQVNLFSGRLHLGRFLVGLLTGAIVGLLIGARVGQFASANSLNTPSLLAAGAYLWLCLWTVIGAALGGWAGRTSTADLEWGIDAIVRYYSGRQWGALLGSVVGYILFLGLCGLLSSGAELAAENERLRGEVTRLRQSRP
jgi:hypothetical protein